MLFTNSMTENLFKISWQSMQLMCNCSCGRNWQAVHPGCFYERKQNGCWSKALSLSPSWLVAWEIIFHLMPSTSLVITVNSLIWCHLEYFIMYFWSRNLHSRRIYRYLGKDKLGPFVQQLSSMCVPSLGINHDRCRRHKPLFALLISCISPSVSKIWTEVHK